MDIDSINHNLMTFKSYDSEIKGLLFYTPFKKMNARNMNTQFSRATCAKYINPSSFEIIIGREGGSTATNLGGKI